MLADPPRWWFARHLVDETAYTKRAISQALGALGAAGLLDVEQAGVQFRYRLARPSEFAQAIGSIPQVFPRWRALLRVIRVLTAYRAGILDAILATERITHVAAGSRLPPVADPSVLRRPAEQLERWALDVTERLAAGDVTLFAAH